VVYRLRREFMNKDDIIQGLIVGAVIGVYAFVVYVLVFHGVAV
jgi:hypothetical protein